MNNEYLSEEKYQKGKGFLKIVAFIIMAVGVFVGVSLILKGISTTKNGGKENLDDYKLQLSEEKLKLESKKSELEQKGIVASRKYDSGESYDLYVITEALDPRISYCLDEYANNSITEKYCNLKNTIDDINDFGEIRSKGSGNFQFIFGVAAIMISLVIGGSILMFAHGREIVAFQAQQVMPVAKEGIDEMAPTIGKAAGTIAAGIKEGLNSSNNDNSNSQ